MSPLDANLFGETILRPGVPKSRTVRRKRPPLQPATSTATPWPLDGEINVVLFAGMGGACQGLEDAGFPVHVAVNHDEIAIAAHRALNPHTRHLQADIYEVDPLEATQGRPVNILWGSPDCRDHSVAKGGAPRSPRVRSMPWQLCRWVGTLRKRGLGPRVVYLENVREIRGWGPLIAKRDKATGRVIKRMPDGTEEVAAKGERVPVPQQILVRDERRKGRLYRAWVRHMTGLGARYLDRDINCADHGVPTGRKRLFGVAVFDDRPIRFPVVTHGQRQSPLVAAGQLLPHRAAAEIINWSLPLPSIFNRAKGDLAAATQRRIATGVKRFVIDSTAPFLIHTTHQGSRPPIDGRDPLPTATTAHRGEMAVVAPTMIQAAHGDGQPGRARRWSAGANDVQDATGTMTTTNAYAIAGATIVPTTHTKSGAGRVHDGQDATPTLTAGVKRGELAVMAATIVGAGGRSAQMGPVDIAGPLNTSTTKEDRVLVAAHLTKFQQNSVGQHPEDALDTVMAGAPRFGVVAAHLTAFQTRSVGQDAQDPMPTQMTADHHGIAAAFLAKHNQGIVGNEATESLSTLTTTGSQINLAAAYLVHQRGTGVPHDAEAPLSAVSTGGGKGGSHHQVVAAHLTEYYGTGGQHQDAGAALNTVTTLPRFAVTGAELAPPPLTPEQIAGAKRVADFLRLYGAWDGGDMVTVVIGGDTYIIVDIGMRMLTPEEAAAAHELKLPALIRVQKRDRKGQRVFDAAGVPVMIERPLTKSEAMRLVGNSVPKRMAMLLAQANATHTLDAPMMAAE
ncbi:DNA cytosine methyltransferase [Nitrospirillum amazonense]|uniref:DNA cytosine methyltransferase n=1 Tax=Nitrospirillum amazonense TaxID=28077 RepID=UPI002DD427C7|nr:DNA cytosine methyltransferase [Nitrospirillum amazonense]MEC4591656.1 DNA cytosine methyltransferase [Nitrospirillum amazonense]